MSVTSAARAWPAALSPPVRLALRQLLTLVLVGAIVILLFGAFADLDPAAIADAVARLGVTQWVAAAGLAVLSFWAIGQYDVLVHRHLRSGRGSGAARRAGLVSVAICQMAGGGVVTGALVRLRMLPGFGMANAVRLTLVVTVVFLIGWGSVTALAFALSPAETFGPARPIAWVVLASAAALAALCLWRPHVSLLGRRFDLPTLPVLVQSVGLAVVDTVAAALCLAVLLPPEIGVPLAILIPAFLLAFGAGLVSGVPGGIGPFELTLLALMPVTSAEPLLAGVLAWRLVYYVLPALGALAILAYGPAAEAKTQEVPEPAAPEIPLPAEVETALYRAQRAESGILRQGETLLLPLPRPAQGAVIARTGQTLTLLGRSFGADDPTVVKTLEHAARAEARFPCLYKTGARSAAAARQAGWRVLPLAMDARVPTEAFTISAAAFRQLRRKLRKAEAAGVCVSRAPRALPLSEMAEISRLWAAARGGERGGSMGRFSAGYVADQRVYLAHQGGRLVAFVTFHQAEAEWALDLMRTRPDVPDGTMHALVAHAIADARENGCPWVSLAALPHPRLARLANALPGRMSESFRTEGLAQFKRSFAPVWEPLYLAAPSWPALILAAFDLARMILRPRPLAAGQVGVPNHATTVLPSKPDEPVARAA